MGGIPSFLFISPLPHFSVLSAWTLISFGPTQAYFLPSYPGTLALRSPGLIFPVLPHPLLQITSILRTRPAILTWLDGLRSSTR